MFLALLVSSFAGIAKLIGLGVVATLLLAGRRPPQWYLDSLNMLFVRLALPCIVFTRLAADFRPGSIPYWWVYPLLSVFLFAGAGILAHIYTRLDKATGDPGIFVTSAAFHNSMLLPLVIAPVLFSGERLTTFLTLLFLYNILAVPAFFIVGVWMVNKSSGSGFSLGHLASPPTVATVLGLAVSAGGWYGSFPGFVRNSLELFADITQPLSVLVVGGIIVASFARFGAEDWRVPVKLLVLKSIAFPVLVCLGVILTKPSPLIALFLMLGSAMPVGSTIAAIIPPDEQIQKTVAGGILLTSLASIIVVPILMSVYGMVFGW